MIRLRKKLSMLLVTVLIICLSPLTSKAASAETIVPKQKYLQVNQITLEFNEVIYVDCMNGDDTNGDGSKNKPFKTILKGFDYLNINCRVGGALVIKDGTYDVDMLFKGNSFNLNPRYNGMKISLLAETMGKVKFINVREMMLVENSSSSRIKLNVYGIILDCSGRGFHIGGDDWVNEYYNCVITPGYGGYNSIVANANVKVENSLFIGTTNPHYYSAPIKGYSINCASTTQFMDPYRGSKANALYNVTIDSDYNITSDGWEHAGIGTNPDGSVANIGVYGGQFAWGSKVTEVSKPSKLKVVLEVKEQLQLSVDDDLAENTQMNWTSSDNTVAIVDSNGVVTALKPGNTVVTVISKDGTYTDKINVLVVDDADDYRLAVDLKVGKSCRLTVDDLTDTVKVTWASMDPTVATVSDKGKVTAVSKGLALVTATDDKGNMIGQIYIRVRVN